MNHRYSLLLTTHVDSNLEKRMLATAISQPASEDAA